MTSMARAIATPINAPIGSGKYPRCRRIARQLSTLLRRLTKTYAMAAVNPMAQPSISSAGVASCAPSNSDAAAGPSTARPTSITMTLVNADTNDQGGADASARDSFCMTLISRRSIGVSDMGLSRASAHPWRMTLS